jgi:6-phosphofructokinase 1
MLIGILTGGGDCPGLNAVIRAAVKTAAGYGWQTLGIEEGVRGLVQRKARALGPAEVSGILQLGGTILGTTNAGDPFRYPVREGDSVVERDVSAAALENFRALGLDALVVVGGDGTLRIAQAFHEKGMPLVGIPKTIDNDLGSTDRTFGFDSAVTRAMTAIDAIQDTAESHGRVMIVELMGRDAGHITLHAGIAAGADVILIPEMPYRLANVIRKIAKRTRLGIAHTVIAIAEGARPVDGEIEKVEEGRTGHLARYGGAAEALAERLRGRIPHDIRVTVLGHVQRGGPPTAFDRVLGTRFGVAAVDLLAAGKSGRMVCLRGTRIESVTFETATSSPNLVDPEGELVRAARAVGTELGS